MVEIKICGIKRIEDVEFLNNLMPDYAGFIFAPSKRRIDIETAKYLIGHLDKRIKCVGVFVDEDLKVVKNISNLCNLDVLQFHGDETPKYCSEFKKEVWKGFRMKNKDSLTKIQDYTAYDILLDAFHLKMHGGSGTSFDWHLVSKFRGDYKMIVAGGLTSNNVLECIQVTNPDIVDVSSGVETNGNKDFYKMKEFIEKVRKINE